MFSHGWPAIHRDSSAGTRGVCYHTWLKTLSGIVAGEWILKAEFPKIIQNQTERWVGEWYQQPLQFEDGSWEWGFRLFLALVESQHSVRVRIIFAEAGEIIHPVKCWSCQPEDPSSIPRTHVKNLGVVAHAYCPRAGEGGTSGPQRLTGPSA